MATVESNQRKKNSFQFGSRVKEVMNRHRWIHLLLESTKITEIMDSYSMPIPEKMYQIRFSSEILWLTGDKERGKAKMTAHNLMSLQPSVDEEEKKYVNRSKRHAAEAKPNLQWFSSLQTGLSCFDGLAEMKRLNIEKDCLLFFSKKRFDYSNTAGRYCIAPENIIKDYFCILQGGEGRCYIDLMEKILYLRNELMEEENEYIPILGGKCSKNEDDNKVYTRRELECAEKVYLISRRRKFGHQISTSYPPNYEYILLTRMICQKQEIMKLEGEYVELLKAGATFYNHTFSQYSEDVLQRAVSSKRECLELEQLYVSNWSTFDVQPIYFQMLFEVEKKMVSLWERRQVYPYLAHDFNMNTKMSTLERMVNLREEYLNLEDEYLCILQDRYDSTSFDVRQIHTEYLWEHLIEMTLRWRSDLTLLEDIHASQLKEDESTHEFVKLFKKFKLAEGVYCKLIRKRLLSILGSTSLMDVTQIYEKYNHPNQVDHIRSLRMKIKKLEFNCVEILRKCERVIVVDSEHLQIETTRINLHQIEDQYFCRLEDNVAAKHFLQLQQTPLQTKGGQSSVIDIVLRDENITSVEPSNGVRRWEIRRCIVLGGLFESITSLVIITATATANLRFGNILVLALTNLITGLFFIRHEISGLQKKRSRRIEVEGRQYKELVKDGMYYVLNFMIAFLSFLFFGLVAPLVYAFSYLKIGNNNMAMIAAAGASLTCTTFLAIQKAHLLKPRNSRENVYMKTAGTYLLVGVGAFVISYLAGYMFGNFLHPFVSYVK